jgi:signal transduction histidine kinase
VILSERGLVPAVKALAWRSPVPVDLTVRVAGRLPDQVELGAYYIVSEALANAAKHANAEMVVISVEVSRGVLSLSVRDDGVGGADPDSSGLTGLRERAEALGGTLKLTSLPGRGTSVDVKRPADSGSRILQVRRTWSVRLPPGRRCWPPGTRLLSPL